jgi:L-threonylcarbamoyladenylate synthase
VIDAAVEAIRAGKPVILPTDTVYGLCTTPYSREPVERLYRLKGRPETQPTAILASDVDMLFECVPELRGRTGRLVRTLLPGPYTLVLPNPARRFRWLTGGRPDTIGVRVPELTGDAEAVLARAGAVVATSANLPGRPEPRRLEDVPRELREGAAAEIDGSELPGKPSTVIDLTGPEPRVLREGAGSVEEALERARAAAA